MNNKTNNKTNKKQKRLIKECHKHLDDIMSLLRKAEKDMNKKRKG